MVKWLMLLLISIIYDLSFDGSIVSCLPVGVDLPPNSTLEFAAFMFNSGIPPAHIGQTISDYGHNTTQHPMGPPKHTDRLGINITKEMTDILQSNVTSIIKTLLKTVLRDKYSLISDFSDVFIMSISSDVAINSTKAIYRKSASNLADLFLADSFQILSFSSANFSDPNFNECLNGICIWEIDDISSIQIGVDLSHCKKFKLKLSSTLRSIPSSSLEDYGFTTMFELWEEIFKKNEINFFEYDGKVFPHTKEFFQSNLTYSYDVAGDFLRIYYLKEQGFNITNDDVYNDLIDNNMNATSDLLNFRNFYNYEVYCNSNLYNAVTFDSFFHFLIRQANNIIQSKEPVARVISLAIEEKIFSACFKFLNYHPNFKLSSNSFTLLPYITRGNYLTFELYSRKITISNTSVKEYYVAFRRDNNPKPISVLRTDTDFSNFFQQLLFVPEMDQEEKLSYCE